MIIDFKTKNWERVEVNEKIAIEALNKIKSGEIACIEDCKKHFAFSDWDYIGIPENTDSDQMETRQNSGFSTIEVWDEGNMLYHNGISDEDQTRRYKVLDQIRAEIKTSHAITSISGAFCNVEVIDESKLGHIGEEREFYLVRCLFGVQSDVDNWVDTCYYIIWKDNITFIDYTKYINERT